VVRKKDGFGDRVSEAFPSAIKEIKEAGSCYATGRYTAYVFHSMRILEHGLRVLAKDVSIAIGRRGWGKIIGRIELAINPPPSQKPKVPQTKEEIERQRFLSEVATDFRYFKDAWRDYVTHNLVDYKGPEALRIMDRVKDFMAHISEKLKE
jgi:hypothetical protein